MIDAVVQGAVDQMAKIFVIVALVAFAAGAVTAVFLYRVIGAT